MVPHHLGPIYRRYHLPCVSTAFVAQTMPSLSISAALVRHYLGTIRRAVFQCYRFPNPPKPVSRCRRPNSDSPELRNVLVNLLGLLQRKAECRNNRSRRRCCRRSGTGPTATVNTLPLPCVSTAFVAKTLSLSCGSTAFVVKDSAFALRFHCLRG